MLCWRNHLITYFISLLCKVPSKPIFSSLSLYYVNHFLLQCSLILVLLRLVSISIEQELNVSMTHQLAVAKSLKTQTKITSDILLRAFFMLVFFSLLFVSLSWSSPFSYSTWFWTFVVYQCSMSIKRGRNEINTKN